jgi:hypothetical protein
MTVTNYLPRHGTKFRLLQALRALIYEIMSSNRWWLINFGGSIVLRSLPYKTPGAFIREVCPYRNCNICTTSRHVGHDSDTDLCGLKAEDS